MQVLTRLHSVLHGPPLQEYRLARKCVQHDSRDMGRQVAVKANIACVNLTCVNLTWRHLGLNATWHASTTHHHPKTRTNIAMTLTSTPTPTQQRSSQGADRSVRHPSLLFSTLYTQDIPVHATHQGRNLQVQHHILCTTAASAESNQTPCPTLPHPRSLISRAQPHPPHRSERSMSGGLDQQTLSTPCPTSRSAMPPAPY
jgi:hypothetical protein